MTGLAFYRELSAKVIINFPIFVVWVMKPCGFFLMDYISDEMTHAYEIEFVMGFNFGFFGSQEHRVFNYRPRYYDPAKEELKEKFGKVDGSLENEPYTPGNYIKGSLRDGNYQRTRNANRAQKIIGIVGLILFFVVLVLIIRLYSMLWS